MEIFVLKSRYTNFWRVLQLIFGKAESGVEDPEFTLYIPKFELQIQKFELQTSSINGIIDRIRCAIIACN